MLTEILKKQQLSRSDIVRLLQADKEEARELFEFSRKIRFENFGNAVYYRGIIEFSNICRKNCLYCGIRRDIKSVERFDLPDNVIIDTALRAFDQGLVSLVLQSGERTDKAFVRRIERLIRKIKQLTAGKMGITLSLGEQDYDVYKTWFEAGAHRYLLRIEVSDPELYKKLHPNDKLHDYYTRLNCLYALKDIGYQVGTGVMIGLPFQTLENLANDLLFMRDFDIDMVGMGPYIEHSETPLYEYSHLLRPLSERLFLTMKMLAILRILMPDINIAATTALQAIDPMGREKALSFACNVVMPNITPDHRKDYFLYEGKPCVEDGEDACIECLNKRLEMYGLKARLGQWGDSPHYFSRRKTAIQTTG